MGRTKLNVYQIKLTDSEMVSLGLDKSDPDIALILKKMLLNESVRLDQQSKNRDKYLGTKSKSKDGKVIEIIEFRSYNDFDISFTDNTIVYGCNMYQFEHELICYPIKDSMYIGMKVVCSNGQVATIIQFFSKSNITVQFSDGTICPNKRLYDFKRGYVKNPNYNPYIGKINASGDKIIEAISKDDITVKRNDDTIIEHTTYALFKKCFPVKKEKERISRASDGSIIKAINFVNEHDFDVLFVETGDVIHCRSINNFNKGLIRNPRKRKHRKVKTDRLGEFIEFNNGKIGFISEYINSNNVTVTLLPSKEKLEHCSYASIKKGHFPKQYLEEVKDTSLHYGKKILFNNGETGVIIAYHNYHNVDVQLSNGSVVKNCDYDHITKGMFPYSKLEKYNLGHLKYIDIQKKNGTYQNKRQGEIITFKNGVVCTIHRYFNLHDVSIKFDNGFVLCHCDYVSVKKGHFPYKAIKESHSEHWLKEYM